MWGDLMGRFVFDVTDIVDYTRKNKRVSGIQRVQLKLIGSLVREHGAETIRICCWHSPRNEMVHFDPSEVLADKEFDGTKFQVQLGLLKPTVFPPRDILRKYLGKFSRGNLDRAWLKLKVYLACLFDVHSLERSGLVWGRQYKKVNAVALHKLDDLTGDDVLIFLGSNWSHGPVLQFGKSYRDSGGVVIQMIYDLIPFLRPDLCPAGVVRSFSAFLEKSVQHASSYLCISEWTKRDLEHYLKSMDVDRNVDVLRLAHEFDGYARNERVEQPGSNQCAVVAGKRYVLCVGTIEERKNGMLLLRAWSQMAKDAAFDLPLLVFAGKWGGVKGGIKKEFNNHPELNSLVVIIDSPSDKDLAFLYSNCLFSVFPSIFEGWGLPVGEAAWFGRYVIASNATSVPEVCGDLVDYFDPNDLGDIVKCLGRAIMSPGYVQEKEGKVRTANLDTWDDVARSLFYLVGNALAEKACAAEKN